MYRFNGVSNLTGRFKMFCRLLILVFFSSLFGTPTVSHVIQKRAAFYIANETMCIVDGDVYRNGDPVPTDDECERCTCRPPGFSCVLRDCDTKPGCKAVRRVGECCPEYVCGCVHNSRLYEDGELIKDLQNNCYTCRCHGSSISCTFADCHFRSDCPPEYIPGECCPRYDHCPTEVITTTTTTTTTASPSTHIIQHEVDFFNLTSHHVQKFTSEGTTVTIEDVTPTAFTTPSSKYTVKFSLSGEKISSIHDFDTAELTTLLPLQTVTYKETTRHIMVPQDTELTTIKDGLIFASFDGTTESVSTSSKTEIKSESPEKSAIDASILTSTESISDTSPKVSFTENNVMTILTEDVSDWDDELKIVQEAESHESDLKGQDVVTDSDEQVLITDEITQQESGHTQTELKVVQEVESSSHEIQEIVTDADEQQLITEEITKQEIDHSQTGLKTEQEAESLDFEDDSKGQELVTDFDKQELVTDEITQQESSRTQTEIPLFNYTSKSTIEVFSHGVTPEDVSGTEHAEISSSEELQTESTTESLKLVTDLLSTTTIDDETVTRKATDSVDYDLQSSIDDIHSTANESLTQPSHIITSESEEIQLTTQKATELGQQSEVLNISSYADEYSSTSEVSTAQDIYSTSHSIIENFERTSHHPVESLSDKAETPTDVAQIPLHSTEVIDSYEFLHAQHAITVKETSHVTEPTDVPEFQSSVDDLSQSNESDIALTSTPSDGHFSSSDIETTAYSESDKDFDYSNEITKSTIKSVVQDITSPSRQFAYTDEYNTIATTDLEGIHSQSTKHPEGDKIHILKTDEKYDTTIKSEISYDVDKETTKEYGTDESLNKTDSDFIAVGENEEIEAESEAVTTEVLSQQTTLDHITQDAEINTRTKQTSKVETITETTISEEKKISASLNNVDQNATQEVSSTEDTSSESISSIDHSLINDSYTATDEIFSSGDITKYTTESSINIFKITESDTKEDTSKDIIEKSDSATDDSVSIKTTLVTDELTSQPSSTSETMLETTTDKMPIDDKKTEIIPIKQEIDVSATSYKITTQTPKYTETTFKVQTTEKITTTTNDDMPNELPAFEPPLANILKQHMLFNRPSTQTEASNIQSTKANISKDTSEENQIEKLSLSVEEADENILDSSDLDESGNKIIPLNHEYTIDDSQILSTAETPGSEKPNAFDENNDNLYFIKAEHDNITQTSGNEQTSTEIIYNIQTTSNIESPTHNYAEDKDLTSNIEVMDSEELHNELFSKENNVENLQPNDSITTSLYEANVSDTENNSKPTETTTYLINNSQTNSVPQKESNIVEDGKSDSTINYTPTTSESSTGHSNFIDTVTSQDHLNGSFELTKPDLVDEIFNKNLIPSDTSTVQEVYQSSDLEDSKHETDSDVVYEDAESLEKFIDRSTIHTSTAADDLQTHLITSEKDFTLPSLSDKSEISTESRPVSSDLDFTSVTSDSAKEEYLAAMKFSTLYEQKIFTTSQEYQTFASISPEIQNILSTTETDDAAEMNNKDTSNVSSELILSEHPTTMQPTHHFTEEHIVAASDETLSHSKEYSTILNSFNNLFSTLKHTDSEDDSSTNQDVMSVTTQSSYESSIDQNELSSLSTTSTEAENLTQSLDQTYGSRLKNEFAEYGVLGGVFITGKSKYKENFTDDKGEFINSHVDQEINLPVENNNLTVHNHSDDLELENDAETDYSMTDSELNTKYASDTVPKNEEKSEFEHDETENENLESIEKEIIVEFSTAATSNGTKLAETSNTETVSETTVINLTNDISSDDTLSVTTKSGELSNVFAENQTDSEKKDDGSFLTNIEIEQEKGPEKGGEWFEPTEPNLNLADVDSKENSTSTTAQFDSTTINLDVSTESDTEHGPEKGGEVFKPTLPDLFPINNANPDTEAGVITNEDHLSTTRTIDLNNKVALTKDHTSVTSLLTESKSGSETTTESNIKFDFVPPLPILLRSLPKFMQQSKDSRNNSGNPKPVNYDNVNPDHDYMSDDGSIEFPPKLASERKFNPSYDLSGIISKVFKAPGYDAEVHLSSLKDNPDLKKSQFFRLKRDTNVQSGTSKITQQDSQPNNKLPPGSREDTYLISNKNILLIEGYGQKQSGFFPITSSLIIVHSDEENETKTDSKQDKSENESKDILTSKFLDEIKPVNPEKDYKFLSRNDRHPKM